MSLKQQIENRITNYKLTLAGISESGVTDWHKRNIRVLESRIEELEFVLRVDSGEWVSVKNPPQVETKVILEVQHWESKNLRYMEVKKVNEDDCSWRCVDDNSEISYDWTPIRYLKLPLTEK